MRGTERVSYSPKATQLRSDRGSTVSDPWVLDTMLQMACDEEHPLERWVAPVPDHGRCTGRKKVAADQRDGIVGASFLPTSGGCLSGGIWGAPCVRLLQWGRLPGPAAWGLASQELMSCGGFSGRERQRRVGREKGEGEGDKTEERQTKITSFVYAQRKDIWLTEGGG